MILLLGLLLVCVGSANSEDATSLAYCNRTSFDIVLVIDGSSSIGNTGFVKTREWAVDFGELFMQFPDSKIGLVQFSTRAYLTQPLTSNKNIFLDSASNMEFLCRLPNVGKCLHDIKCFGSNSIGCQTATGDGLQLAFETFSSANFKTEKFKKDIIVVLTDGRWNIGRDPVEVLPEIFRSNVTVIAVGVGVGVNRELVRTLASPGPVNDTDRYFILSGTFEELNETLGFLHDTICTFVPIPPDPEESPPEPNPGTESNPTPSGDDPFSFIPFIVFAIVVGAIALILRPKKKIVTPVPPTEFPEITVIPPVSAVSPPMDSDLAASGAPPAGPNRPYFNPASRITPSKFNGRTVTRSVKTGT